ncbi:hypothetical protein WICMUC_003811 [Wickerhamomyces mucosus]|uniref:HPP transmembrane region domain-containing protein n=1 Tax=Wickerhamomyces mucosus TaxID=1378264 RepID=A0A9P8PJ84_9ASCO|nr:hypothetical protein WICMUC_003811 [Wickerhamomyces mucosus]
MSHHITLDKIIDPFVPPSQVNKFPKWISRWIGGERRPVFDQTPDYILWIDIFIGSFASILTIEGVFMTAESFKIHNTPIIVASYGATAILAFNAINAPFSQPRNIFIGHVLASILGVCICKLFELSVEGRNHFYVGGAIAVGLSSVVMFLTNTIHPPAGATALIAVIDEDFRALGWFYIVVHIVSSLLVIGVALLTNNVFRKYPAYWWTPYQQPVAKDEESIAEDIPHTVSITGLHMNIPKALILDSFELEALESIQSKLDHLI